MTPGTLTASPVFSWGAERARTWRPQRAPDPVPSWRDVVRWSWDWPNDVREGDRPVYVRVVGRWRVRVA